MLVLFAIIGLALQWKNPYIWAWGAGSVFHVLALLYIIDRFSLRYFVIVSLLLWVLAGIGLGSIISKIKRDMVVKSASIVLSVLLIAWVAAVVVVPFRMTGGSTNKFSLGNREDSASAFVDIEPLITCLEGKGPLYSESVHIWNRLEYLSHSNEALEVIPEEQKSKAKIIIQYRDSEHPEPGILCPELTHFRVFPAK